MSVLKMYEFQLNVLRGSINQTLLPTGTIMLGINTLGFRVDFNRSLILDHREFVQSISEQIRMIEEG